jgi:lysyl-tRNA synthetase class 2
MGILSEKIDGKLISVDIQSSNLKNAVYNTETEDLTITFNNGSIYEYNKVPWTKFTKLRLAESQGKYFNENISKNHKFNKLK